MSTDGLIGSGRPIGRPPMEGGADNKADKGRRDILYTMRQRFEAAMDAEQENRASYTSCVKMCSSAQQWDEEVKEKRGKNRPAMTFNQLNLIVKQIIGDYRQNKMSISVLPAGSQATEEMADILAGIIRNIEMDSHADQAYTNGLECAARGGFGWFRIMTEYEADDVFDQKLVIKPIHNPLTVYCDPMARMITRADANYIIITEMMRKDAFAKQYPKANPNGWDANDNDDSLDDWQEDENIRIAEYYTKELVTARLVGFNNGAVVQINSDEEITALEQIGWKVTQERESERTNIKWRKCTALDILEERTYRAKYIPVIPVLGEEINIEGKPKLRSAVYYSIDAQKSYNYERSTQIERNALSAKAPWLVTQKMIEQWKEQWDRVNNTPQPYLIYSVDTQNPASPMPQRIEPPTPAAAEIQGAQAAAVDIQRTSGIFNSQIGQQTNVQSGVGLQEQQSQGNTSTFIFSDNLRTSIEHGGRVLADWIPTVYDAERVVRIINSEDNAEMMTVNQQKTNPILGTIEVLNDITIGKYDVIVTAGKAFASRRKEAVEGMLTWAQRFPQQAPLVADLVIRNMDVPGGEVMADRIKRSLPPQVVNDPDSPEGQQAAAQAQQQQAQQQGMMQQMLQSKLQVEQGKNQAEMAKNNASVIKSQAEVVKAKADVMQANIQAHNSRFDHAAKVMDMARGQQEDLNNQVMQSQQQASPQESNTPSDNGMDMLKQGIGAIAQHLAQTHHENRQHANAMQQILGHIAQGNQEIGNHLARQNAIASAPLEAVRDKNGRITGSRRAI